MRSIVTSATYPGGSKDRMSKKVETMKDNRSTNYQMIFQSLRKDTYSSFESIYLLLDQLNSQGLLHDSCFADLFSNCLAEEEEECTEMHRICLLLKTSLKYIGDYRVSLSQRTLIMLLAKLWEMEGNFQVIFEEMLKPLNGGDIEDFYPCLRYYLRHVGNRMVMDNGREVSLVDAPLAFGETPLMAACKNRRPGAIALLIRHGANPVADWLGYTHAVQVLLFSPNKCYVSGKDKDNIEACLSLLISATGSVDLSKLKHLENDGYYPNHDKWKTVMENFNAFGPCSLQKLCKLKIRDVLRKNNVPPHSSQAKLPIPTRLLDYIHIKQHAGL